MKSQLTVGFLPWWPQNPYQILLKQELNRLDVRVIGNPPLNFLRILLKRDGLDVVHVHWPHGLYLNKVWMFPYAILVLLLYRILKNNIVWTVHELDFYETKIPFLDRIMRAMLMKICRALFVHGKHSIAEIQERYGFKRDIELTYHPSYLGYYGDAIQPGEARRQLGLPKAGLVYLFFGYIKPYKGVEELIAAFREVDNDNSILLIAGNPLNDEIRNDIENLASQNSQVKTDLRYIRDEEIPVYFSAADVVVFPFRRTQTSGSIMLALTYGKPVIVPELATLPEYVDSSMGFLFDPDAPGSLGNALRKSMKCDLPAMGKAAMARAQEHTWEDMALKHLGVYSRVAGLDPAVRDSQLEDN